MEKQAFELGRVIWEARLIAAWHPDSVKLRMKQNPWPEHVAAERAAEHDLAIASAKAVLKSYAVSKKPVDGCGHPALPSSPHQRAIRPTERRDAQRQHHRVQRP